MRALPRQRSRVKLCCLIIAIVSVLSPLMPISTAYAQSCSTTHTVRPDDTLYSIYRANPGTTVALLKAWNGLTSDTIRTNQVLCVSAPTTAAPATTKAPSTTVPALDACKYVDVIAGQTVYRIALDNGISETVLMKANQITDPKDLRAGQRLCIPVQPAAVAQVAESQPTATVPATKPTVIGIISPDDPEYEAALESFYRKGTPPPWAELHPEYPWKYYETRDLDPLATYSGASSNDASMLRHIALVNGTDETLTGSEAGEEAIKWAEIFFHNHIVADLEELGIHPYDVPRTGRLEELVQEMVDVGYDLREMLNTLDYAIRSNTQYERLIEDHNLFPPELQEAIEDGWKALGYTDRFPDNNVVWDIWASVFLPELDPEDPISYNPDTTREKLIEEFMLDIHYHLKEPYNHDWGEAAPENDAKQERINIDDGNPCRTIDPEVIATSDCIGDASGNTDNCDGLGYATCKPAAPINDFDFGCGPDGVYSCAGTAPEAAGCPGAPIGTRAMCNPDGTIKPSRICSGAAQSCADEPKMPIAPIPLMPSSIAVGGAAPVITRSSLLEVGTNLADRAKG